MTRYETRQFLVNLASFYFGEGTRADQKVS
jgi:hypothetical protein